MIYRTEPALRPNMSALVRSLMAENTGKSRPSLEGALLRLLAPLSDEELVALVSSPTTGPSISALANLTLFHYGPKNED